MTAEEYIEAYTRRCSNENVWGQYEPWMTIDGCKEAVRLAREDAISILWHPASEAPEMHRNYLIMRPDGHISGSWERHDDESIPWKDVVKEHKFSHWCYTEDLQLKKEY